MMPSSLESGPDREIEISQVYKVVAMSTVLGAVVSLGTFDAAQANGLSPVDSVTAGLAMSVGVAVLVPILTHAVASWMDTSDTVEVLNQQ